MPSASSPDDSAPVAEDLVPSPLPGVFELASLAAALMPAKERTPADAARLAIELWGAALGQLTERAVEEARLKYAADRPAAAARWERWQLRHLGLEETAARETAVQRQWDQRAARVFKGIAWPAPFDQILRLIRDAPLDELDAQRHREFSAVWIAAHKRTALEELERRWEFRKPREWSPEMSPGRPRGTPEQLRLRMQKDLRAAQQRWEAGRQAEIDALDARLHTAAASLRSEEWDIAEATRALRLWKEHTSTAQRRAAGRKPKKR